MLTFGAFAAKSGYNIVHYTLELSEVDVGHRYDSRISEISVDDLYDNKAFVKQKITEDVKGKIVIKSYPTKSVGVQALKNHYATLVLRGLKPEVVIVDYGDLLKSRENYEAKRLNEEAVYEELRGWAMEINTPIWTVTQINREGMDVEVITLKYISECIAKAFIADLFLTMNRKKDSPQPELGNIFFAKNRLGPDGIKLPMLINTAISKIQVLAPEFNDDQDSNEDAAFKLKEKFKNFQKKMASKNDGTIN